MLPVAPHFGVAPERYHRRRWLQRAALLALPCTGVAAWGKNHSTTSVALHVLLIGNSRYQHNAVLGNPARDVKLLSQSFASRGAQVHTALDLTAQQLDATIQNFLQPLQRKPVAIWIGYSGHAVQIEGLNYLQGIDSDFTTPQRVRTHGVNVDKITRLIERIQPSAGVVSIDACRNNPFEPERTRSMSQGLAPLKPVGLCISYSTAPYMRALDGDEGQYSPYAHALAQALSGNQAKSLDQVLRETADSVYARTQKRQVPEYRSALRAEWWFASRHVALRTANSEAATGAVLSTSTREFSYRPDEPITATPYARTTSAQWTQLEVKLMSHQRGLSTAQARQLVQSAARASSVEVKILAAMVLEDGHAGVPAQPDAARVLLAPLAEQGHVIAQNLLGESWFIARQYDLAYKWLSLAARSGYSRARTNLGQMHARGHGGADPVAGALEILQGMMQQGQEQTFQTPGALSPEAQQRIQQLQDMLRGTKR